MTFPEADIFLKSGDCAGQTMLDTMEAPGHSRQLLLQLNNQRTKGFLCDVIIVVQNALFRAHKNVLAASSAYLKSLVVHDNLLNLDHDMVSPAVFRLVLDFIYTGRLADGAEAAAAAAVAPGTEPSLGAVLAAASYLQIPDLVALCKKRLKRHGKYCHLRGGGGGGGGYAPYGRPGDLLTIAVNGPPIANFDAKRALDSWFEEKSGNSYSLSAEVLSRMSALEQKPVLQTVDHGAEFYPDI